MKKRNLKITKFISTSLISALLITTTASAFTAGTGQITITNRNPNIGGWLSGFSSTDATHATASTSYSTNGGRDNVDTVVTVKMNIYNKITGRFVKSATASRKLINYHDSQVATAYIYNLPSGSYTTTSVHSLSGPVSFSTTLTSSN